VAGKSKIWAMRMPGGMTKIIKSNSEITESDAKDIYKDSFKYKSARCLNDLEAVWPLCKPIDESEMHKDFAQFVIESPVSGTHRHLVEI
jgi:hypothetical protein